jgi:mRNA interferase RelE/StbE
MVWKIEIAPRAERELSKMGHTTRRLIQQYIDKRILLSDDPRDLGKPLGGDLHGIWRYRVDKYRILCRIQEQRLVILVVEVGKRDSVYD